MTAGIPAGRAWLAVAVGGLAGTELRYGLGLAFPDTPGAVPWATLWMARPRTAFWLRAGLGPGLLGSFTTFSAVALSLDQSVRAGNYPIAIAYLFLSLLLGLGAAGLGWRTGRLVRTADAQKPGG